MLEALFGHRQADQAASEFRHEVDGFGCDLLGRESEVPFVLAVFVVDDHDHPACADFFNCVGHVGKWDLGTHIEAILVQFDLIFTPEDFTTGEKGFHGGTHRRLESWFEKNLRYPDHAS